ncbi:MAG: hypothetical protein NDI77_01465 [Geobacteraceae bacterium]|nr:hypothetical protein [Geobacteraceae bacterium]
MKRATKYLLVGVFTMVAGLAGQPGGPMVVTANAAVVEVQGFGASYGEWAARWWEWALSIPAAQNPILDQTGANCEQGQVGNVWFLAGTFGGSATRDCTIPSGKPLFLPLINNLGFSPTGNDTVIALRLLAADLINNVDTLTCTLDGAPCAANLFAFRAQSPIFEAIVRPGGLVAPKFYDPMVADGYWLLLVPLDTGAHVLEFGATTNNGFSTSVTYNLNVL